LLCERLSVTGCIILYTTNKTRLKTILRTNNL
jgi:hypothetical protein